MALTVQNQNYVSVAFANSPVTLTCKDNEGNTFNRNTCLVNATAGIVAINLPYIPSLNDALLTEIVIIVTDDTSNIVISPTTPVGGITQKIGSATSLTIASGGGIGQSVILRPVTEGLWAFTKTA